MADRDSDRDLGSDRGSDRGKENDTILVAFDQRTPFSEDVVTIASRLTGRRRRAIHVYSLVTVPNNLPLDAPMAGEVGDAVSKIERAKLVAGGMRVTGAVARVRPAQAGYSVAEKAREIRAGAVVIGLRVRNGVPVYDDTVRQILAERPCRVIVVSAGGTDRGAGTVTGPGPAGRAGSEG